LIELLVVIAIIGLLASVVIASLSSARAKGRDARRVADLKAIQTANELYFDANGVYATSTANLTGAYIASVPVDPLNQSGYLYSALDTDSDAATCEAYHVGAVLESVSGAQGVLANDADALPGTACTDGGTVFDGRDADCVGILDESATDRCYDIASL
jgi:type II secretory pathway pseudopilin PulG